MLAEQIAIGPVVFVAGQAQSLQPALERRFPVSLFAEQFSQAPGYVTLRGEMVGYAEYAGHEGNYGMFGMLSGARAQEKGTADAARKGSR